jgi:hypothetical protein
VDTGVRACLQHAHWLDGQPLTNLLAMSGTLDRYRRFVVDNVPVATGVVAVTVPGRAPIRRLAGASRWDRRMPHGCPTWCGNTWATPTRLGKSWDQVTEAELTPW